MQQFHGVRIGEGWSNHSLFEGLAPGLVEKEQGGQVANVGGVVLNADLFGLTVDLDMGIETAVVINTGFIGGSEAIILKERGKKASPPLSCCNDAPGHTE